MKASLPFLFFQAAGDDFFLPFPFGIECMVGRGCAARKGRDKTDERWGRRRKAKRIRTVELGASIQQCVWYVPRPLRDINKYLGGLGKSRRRSSTFKTPPGRVAQILFPIKKRERAAKLAPLLLSSPIYHRPSFFPSLISEMGAASLTPLCRQHPRET